MMGEGYSGVGGQSGIWQKYSWQSGAWVYNCFVFGRFGKAWVRRPNVVYQCSFVGFYERAL